MSEHSVPFIKKSAYNALKAEQFLAEGISYNYAVPGDIAGALSESLADARTRFRQTAELLRVSITI